MVRKTAQDIDLEAAEWVSKVEEHPLGVGDETRFKTWLDSDVRCAGAYARMLAISVRTERAAALGPGFDASNFDADTPTDRKTLPQRRLVMGLMAASVVGVVGVGVVAARHGLILSSKKGQIRQIALSDGSVVTLDTASEVEVRYSRPRRDLVLLKGKAFFEVAHNRERPFVVTAGVAQVRAVGTSFSVGKLEGRPVQVLVNEGVVEVKREGDKTTAPVRLAANPHASEKSANAHASISETAVDVSAVPESYVRNQLAWRSGSLSFEGQTLNEAIKEFNRYNDTKIEVDETLGREEVAGFYQANDPVGFAHAMAASLGARAEVEENRVVIER